MIISNVERHNEICQSTKCEEQNSKTSWFETSWRGEEGDLESVPPWVACNGNGDSEGKRG